MTTMNSAFYADQALNRFPIDSKEATLSSFGAYKAQKSGIDSSSQAKIEANFTKAAAYYGIELEEKAPEPEKRQLLMFKGAAEAVDMNEITSKTELNEAVDFILDKRASTTRASLAEPAKYVLWVAANSDVDLDSDNMRKIAHIAGIGVGDREAIQHELERRGAENLLDRESHEAFWKFAKEVRELPDDMFYREDNLNTVCDVMDNIDFMYGKQYKHASEGYPEDTVFADTMDDLLKQASDLYYVPSAEVTLSKKATLERKDAINAFFQRHYTEYEPLDGDDLIKKVASLCGNEAEALLDAVK